MRFWPPPTWQHTTSRLLQAAIVAMLVVGLGARNLSVDVNATLAPAVTFLPGVLARDYGLPVDSALVLLLTVALFCHALGMLGLYSGVWWYDHVTHTLSAMLVAGVGYTATRAVDRYSDAVYLPPRFLAPYIVLFTLAAGVTWEVLEFLARELAALERGIETPLEHMTGLGLWFVRWTVESSGGTLAIEDDEPRGTVVVIRLPRVDPPGD